MFKLLLWLLFLLQTPDVNLSVRTRFHLAIDQSNASEALMQYLAEQNPKSTYLQAYEAALYMVNAKYQFLPTTKYSSFKKGKNQLEVLIANNPNNVEFRYLRLIIQKNVPKFLGYSDQQTADQLFLLTQYKNLQDQDLKFKIKGFLIKNCKLDAAQIKYLN